MNKQNILVLGGTGKTGSRVAKLLIQQNIPHRIGSRTAAIPFDWFDDSTWDAALKDITAAYISFQPDLAIPGAVEIIANFSSIAAAQGVQKLVLLSGRGEAEAVQCEEAMKEAGIPWTVVRASWFNQNFSEGNFLGAVLSGHVALPAGKVGEPFVDADDIAEVAVAALLDSKHDGVTYEVTGPRLLSFKDAVDCIALATNRPLVYENISMDDYATLMRQYQVPEDAIALVQYLFTEVLDGRNESLGDGVQRALGREPVDFNEYAVSAAASGVWS